MPFMRNFPKVFHLHNATSSSFTPVLHTFDASLEYSHKSDLIVLHQWIQLWKNKEHIFGGTNSGNAFALRLLDRWSYTNTVATDDWQFPVELGIKHGPHSPVLIMYHSCLEFRRIRGVVLWACWKRIDATILRCLMGCSESESMPQQKLVLNKPGHRRLRGSG